MASRQVFADDTPSVLTGFGWMISTFANKDMLGCVCMHRGLVASERPQLVT